MKKTILLILIAMVIVLSGCEYLEELYAPEEVQYVPLGEVPQEELDTLAKLYDNCGRNVYDPDWIEGDQYENQLGEWCEDCGYCSGYDFGCWRDDEVALDHAEKNFGKRSPSYFCWNSKEIILKTITCYGKAAIISVNSSDEFISVNPILCGSDSRGCREAGYSAAHLNHSCKVSYWRASGNSITEV